MSLPGTLPFSTKALQLNNNNNNISNNLNNSNSNNNNTSEGEQSPPGNNSSSSSAQDFSVFANVNIQGSSVSSFSQSQINLNSIASSASDFSDTMSMRSVSMAPELPKRSNSIISLTNNITCTDVKPVLSPRSSADNVTSALRTQPIVSPKLLESLNEERSPSSISLAGAIGMDNNNDNAPPPAISPRTDKPYSYQQQQHQTMADTASPPPTSETHSWRHQDTMMAPPRYSNGAAANRSPFQNSTQPRVPSPGNECQRGDSNCARGICNKPSRACLLCDDDGMAVADAKRVSNCQSHHHHHHHHMHHQPVFPQSPKLQNSYNTDLDSGPFPPISPHVNVPNDAFNHHVPPPLPPRRREKKELDAVHLAQIRQAPDAPEVHNSFYYFKFISFFTQTYSHMFCLFTLKI